jgi:hypothetical protein
MPGSCSSGFRSRPSTAAGISRSKGFEVVRMNSRKPTLISPITAITRARNTSGRLREKKVTAADQPASTTAHSRMEPSCPPHTPEMR